MGSSPILSPQHVSLCLSQLKAGGADVEVYLCVRFALCGNRAWDDRVL